MPSPHKKNLFSKLVAVRYASAVNSLIALVFTTVSCSKGTKVLSMKQSGVESVDVNATTDADGSTTGKIIKDATTTQVLNAGAGSAVDGSQVVFPAGALAIDATVTMGLGANVASSGFAGAVGAGSGFTAAGIPVAVSSNPPTDTGNAMQIILPGPSSSSLSFWLAGDESWIVIFESLRVSDNGKYVSGVIPRSEFTVKNGKAVVSAKNFGTYQVVIPQVPVTARVELEGKVLEIVAKNSVPAPTLTPSKTFNAAFEATISGVSTILGTRFKEYRYTDDGSTPSCSSGISSLQEPTSIFVSVSQTMTIKAVACTKDGDVSAVAMATYTLDNTAPTINIGSPSRTYANATSSVSYVITYTGADILGLTADQVTLNSPNGVIASKSVSCFAPTCTVTLTSFYGGGALGFSIPAGTASDFAGNIAPAAGPSDTFTVDTTPPTVSIDNPSPWTANSSSTVAYTVTYAEATKYNLTSAYVTLNKTGTANGSITVTNGTTSTPTITITGITGDGTLGITVGANTAEDAAGNGNLVSSASATFTVDTTAPTIAISGPSIADAKSSSSVTYTVTYTNADVVSLANGDVTLNKIGTANASSVVVSGTGLTTRTVTISGFTGDGSIGISIAANSARDNAWNQAPAAVSASTITVDTTVPTAPTFSVGTSDFKAAFPETVATTDTNFKEFRYNVGSAPADPTCSSGSVLSAGPYTINIPGGLTQVLKVMACDLAGNGSTVSTATYTYDGIAPVATWTSPSPASSKTGPAVYTLSFSDARTIASTAANVQSKITWTLVSGAAPGGAVAVTGAHPNYTVTVSGFSGDAVMKLVLAPGAVTDSAGNTNVPTNSDNYVIYTTVPAPTVTAGKDFNASFSASISGSATILGGAFKEYRYTLDGSTPSCAVGTASTAVTTSVTIPASTTTLKAVACTTANDVSVVTTSIYTYDITPPTVAVSAPDISWANDSKTANFTVTYTGASSITLANGNVSLNTTGGASSTIVSVTQSSANIYNVQLKYFTGNGTVGITIAAGTATDPAGNSALASAPSATLGVDNITPSVPLITPASATYNGSKALTFTQNATTTDVNFKEFRYTTNGTPPTSCTDGAASAGSYTATGSADLTIKIVACDKVGNMSAVATSNLIYDHSPPTISIASPSIQFANAASIVTYAVSYSGADTITLSPADITLNVTAGVTATKSVSCTPSTCTVTLNSISGNGTIGFSIAAGTASDLAGNTAAAAGPSLTVTVDNTAPNVTNVTSDTSNGSYKEGQSISVQVQFSEPVTVLVTSGTPQLTLNTSGIATYASGSGSNSLTFTYTIGAGQNTADLDYASTTALALNGGLIKDSAGNNATLMLPSLNPQGALGASKSIVIDTTIPTISYASVTTTSPNSSLTPSVSFSLSETAIVTLFSDVTCFVSISSGTSKASGTGTMNTTLLSANATTLIYGKARDAAANESLCTFIGSFTNNTAGPVISNATVTTNSPGITQTPSVAFTLNKGGTVTLYDSATCGTSISASTVAASGANTMTTNSLSANWTTTIYIKALDGLGIASPCVYIGSYTNDITPPSYSWISTNGGTASSSLRPVITLLGDEPAKVKLYSASNCAGGSEISPVVDAESSGPVSIRTFALSTARATSIYVKAEDMAGNSTCSSSSIASYYPSANGSQALPLTGPLSAAPSDGSIRFSWTKLNQSVGYLVTRRINYATEFSPSDTTTYTVGSWLDSNFSTKVVAVLTNADTLPMDDNSVINGISYIYTVWAIGGTVDSPIYSTTPIESDPVKPVRVMANPDTTYSNRDYLALTVGNSVKGAKIAVNGPTLNFADAFPLYTGGITSVVAGAVNTNGAGQMIYGAVDSKTNIESIFIKGQTPQTVSATLSTYSQNPLIAVSGAIGSTENNYFNSLFAKPDGSLSLLKKGQSEIELMPTTAGSYPRGIQLETLSNGDLLGLYAATNAYNAASAIILSKFPVDGSSRVTKSFNNDGSSNCFAVSAPALAVTSVNSWHVFYLCQASSTDSTRKLIHARTSDSGTNWSYETVVNGNLQEPVVNGPSGQLVVNNMSAISDSSGNLHILHWMEVSGIGKNLALSSYTPDSNGNRMWSTKYVSNSSPGYDLVTPQLSLDTSALRMYYVRHRQLGTFSVSGVIKVLKVGELIGRHLPLPSGSTLSSETRFFLGAPEKDFVLGRGAVASPDSGGNLGAGGGGW